MAESRDLTTAPVHMSGAVGEAHGLVLLVIDEGSVRELPLPSSGKVRIGRSETAAVSINRPWVSRQHAILHLGPTLRIEDLGGPNGMRINGSKIAPAQSVEIAPGDVVELGRTLLLVQHFGADRSSPCGPLPHDQPPVIRNATMQQLLRLIERVAFGTINVMLLGETGVGKELMAEAVHRLSPRAEKPFLRLNCAALSETLLESELFGHERGAFTGAFSAKPGLLETAEGGTVFLDEIGDLPVPLQAKLLRAIEERQVLRVGGVKPRLVDVRFVSATNRDLEKEVVSGHFRRDLFFRLNAVCLQIPPLRERPSEVRELAMTFVRESCHRAGRAEIALSAQALAHLERHSWPGNIRELRNVIERAVLLCPSDTIEPEHLPLDQMASSRSILGRAVDAGPAVAPDAPTAGEGSPSETGNNLDDDLARIEKQRIAEALASCAGNQSRAAKLLGITRNKLIKRIQKYGLARPRKAEQPDS